MAPNAPRPQQVVVLDPVPSYRRGLTAALEEAGFSTLAIAELLDLRDIHDGGVWLAGRDPSALLVTLPMNGRWQQIEDMQLASSNLTVVALLRETSAKGYGEALQIGVDGVVAWDATPEDIVHVVAAALRGQVLLPAHVAHTIATLAQRPCRPDWLDWVTGEETQWLCQLAQGVKINRLADSVGYSERAMYRLLQTLYGQMKVNGRSQAVVQAERWGLLDPSRDAEALRGP